MTTMSEIWERLVAGVNLDDNSLDAAVRITAEYEPVGGWGEKLSPPTYPVDSNPDKIPYLVETRFHDGEPERTVMLDSRQSQANRCEEALQAAIAAGRTFLPHLALTGASHGRTHRITSLTAPHRSRDAYFRDSTASDGTPFDSTVVGSALKSVEPSDATALLQNSPTDLVYGVWDSHRSLRLATRFPRIYTSETIGHGVELGRQAAGRSDLIVSGAQRVRRSGDSWVLVDGKDTKGTSKLSELGHGSIPPSFTAGGGVSVTRVSRTATVGFAGLARIRFAVLPEPAARAARGFLAAVALAGDRLAFGRPGLFFRSGCELALLGETLTWVGTGDALTLTRADALALLQLAVDQVGEVGIDWPTEAVSLVPGTELQKAVDRAFYTQPAEDE